MKKFLALALALSMALSLAACGSKTATTSASPSASAAASSSGKALKIAIVTSPSGVDDGSFNQACYEGIKDFIKEHPLPPKAVAIPEALVVELKNYRAA